MQLHVYFLENNFEMEVEMINEEPETIENCPVSSLRTNIRRKNIQKNKTKTDIKKLAFEEQKKFNTEFLKTVNEIKDCVYNFVENSLKEREQERKIKEDKNKIRNSELELLYQLTKLNINESIE